MAFARVPHDARFWRRGDPVRWNRLGLHYVSCDCDDFERYKSIASTPDVILPDELVALDPHWCPSCLAESTQWPPGPCEHCGAIVDGRRSLEDAKRAVREWTGNPDPHIS